MKQVRACDEFPVLCDRLGELVRIESATFNSGKKVVSIHDFLTPVAYFHVTVESPRGRGKPRTFTAAISELPRPRATYAEAKRNHTTEQVRIYQGPILEDAEQALIDHLWPEIDWRPAELIPEDYYSNPVRKPSVPEAIKLAATNLLGWRGVEVLGGKDVLAWVMKDGRFGFAIQGPALRIESRCLGENKWPIHNHDSRADISLQKAFGLDAKVEHGKGWTGIKGGLGQTMSTGEVSLDEVIPAIEGILNHVTATDNCHVTLMPMRGKPWNVGSKCTPYFSAKKQKALCGTRPDGLTTVVVEEQKVPGIDFCTVSPMMHETEGGVVGELDLRTFLVTHSFNLDPKLSPGPASSVAAVAKRIRGCGGLLFPSLAVSEVPSTNFGTCCLVARIPVVLRSLQPYKARQRGWSVTVYNTDAWTEKTSGFIGRASATLFEQLTGTWEPFSYGHMMVLGPEVSDYSGPADARIIKSVTGMKSAFKKKWRTWHREMSAADIEEASDMSDLRYPYMEAKVNGTLAVAGTFPLAVCPSYLKARTKKFLEAIGFDGVLLTIAVPAEMRGVLRQEKWGNLQAAAKAQWDYAWLVRDAVLAWQRQRDAEVDNYKHTWAESVQESLYRGHGAFAKSADDDFNQPRLDMKGQRQ